MLLHLYILTHEKRESMQFLSQHATVFSKQAHVASKHDLLQHWFILQASSQALYGTDLDPEGPTTLTQEVPSDLFDHSGECAAPSYSNMEEVD